MKMQIQIQIQIQIKCKYKYRWLAAAEENGGDTCSGETNVERKAKRLTHLLHNIHFVISNSQAAAGKYKYNTNTNTNTNTNANTNTDEQVTPAQRYTLRHLALVRQQQADAIQKTLFRIFSWFSPHNRTWIKLFLFHESFLCSLQ